MIVIGGGHTQASAHAGRARCGNRRVTRTVDDPRLRPGNARRAAVRIPLDEQRVWAVEDCRQLSGRLERGLVANGDPVVRVAPALTDSSRRAVRQAGKSDPIDATAIARAALREGIDTLPVAFLDEQAHEIRVLTDYRDQLTSERIRLVNRLRWHLVQIAPELEAQIRPALRSAPRSHAGSQGCLAPRRPESRGRS